MTSTQPDDTAPDTGASDTQPDTLPVALSHSQMNAAYDTGQAAPLASAITWLTRYRDAWWVAYERGWLRITDTPTTDELDQIAARVGEAEAAVTRVRPELALRSSLTANGERHLEVVPEHRREVLLRSSLTANGERHSIRPGPTRMRSCCDPRSPRTASATA